MKTTEELFEERYGKPLDKWDKSAKKYDYWDMLDFADYVCKYYGIITLKNKRTKTRDKGYTKLATVPYQKCPVCEGAGQIYIDQLDPHNTSISIGYRTCHVCGGSGIIPMRVLS